MINFEIEHELKSILRPGEKLLWTGKPKTGIVLRPSDAFLIPFSLIWGGFSVFWEYMVLNSGAPIFMAFFGIPFVLVGLYLIIGRFFVDAKKRAKTSYGITAERVIIKSGIFSSEINSLKIESLYDITIKEKADNSGNIALEHLDLKNQPIGLEWPGRKTAPMLEFIEDVTSVYKLIIDLQHQKGNPKNA